MLTLAVLPRSSADRVDEQSGYQIHVIYAVPSNGVDRRRDLDGEIQRSVHAWESFLASQTHGATLRVDTSRNGALDVTFVRLPESDAAIASHGLYVRDELESELAGLGFKAPDKLYAVYYDGGSADACGGGAYPPTLPGHVAAVYLQGTPPGAPPCNTNPVGADPATPGYVDFSVLHEILHTLGLVAGCAPDHTEIDGAADGHVGNDPQDLMYRGPEPWEPSHLDPAHRDYYGNGATGCLDLADSAFLTPTAAHAQPPPAW